MWPPGWGGSTGVRSGCACYALKNSGEREAWATRTVTAGRAAAGGARLEHDDVGVRVAAQDVVGYAGAGDAAADDGVVGFLGERGRGAEGGDRGGGFLPVRGRWVGVWEVDGEADPGLHDGVLCVVWKATVEELGVLVTSVDGLGLFLRWRNVETCWRMYVLP